MSWAHGKYRTGGSELFLGDWAKELAAQAACLDFNDASEEILEYVGAHLSFRNYVPSDSIYLPAGKNLYDWTFAFGPVETRKGLAIAAMRSLLNRKGFKLVVC